MFLISVYSHLIFLDILMSYSKVKLKSTDDKVSPLGIEKLTDKCLTVRALLYIKHIIIILTDFMATSTLREYYTMFPSKLNDRLSYSLRMDDVLCHCSAIFLAVFFYLPNITDNMHTQKLFFYSFY
jgi:hypothetical protein